MQFSIAQLPLYSYIAFVHVSTIFRSVTTSIHNFMSIVQLSNFILYYHKKTAFPFGCVGGRNESNDKGLSIVKGIAQNPPLEKDVLYDK